jgi:hypothetical protein
MSKSVFDGRAATWRWWDAARPLMWLATRIPIFSSSSGMFPRRSAPTTTAFIGVFPRSDFVRFDNDNHSHIYVNPWNIEHSPLN